MATTHGTEAAPQGCLGHKADAIRLHGESTTVASVPDRLGAYATTWRHLNNHGLDENQMWMGDLGHSKVHGWRHREERLGVLNMARDGNGSMKKWALAMTSRGEKPDCSTITRNKRRAVENRPAQQLIGARTTHERENILFYSDICIVCCDL